MTSDVAHPPFPIIRHAARPFLAVLLALPVGPNTITALSLAFGLAAAWTLVSATPDAALWAALFLIISYILDNCDGEIARQKNLTSTFGHRFDSFTDGIVHAAFFAALGHAWAGADGNSWWAWMGWAAAAGSFINYLLTLVYEFRDQDASTERQEDPARPETPYEWFLFGFRELARADFCFLVLALAVFDLHWLLLPAAAIGAQVYWLTQFHGAARRFRV